ncbi:TonB-dependent siderophore receptor [Comamonas composti]|uniref:TonB-dependent siderophore receptor n=1 Tax=Comamonas composti TaxID=408558 RepID=UPI0004221A71|nr:TonB-dependent receptor [Comamonas composti]
MSRHFFTTGAATRSTAFAAQLLCASLALYASAPQAQTAATTAQAQARSYAIPAGPLAGALNQLGRESGVLITFSPALTADAHTQGLNGRYTVPQALAALLAGTELEAQPDASGSYALRRLATVHPATSATSLAEVRVTAEATRSATTEGTGSYTTRSTAAATGLNLSLRETPQSVSVLTRQQIEDLNLTSIGEAAKHITGISTISSDSDRTDLNARGFYIDTYQYDGVPTFVANDFFGASMLDPIIYDRIEVVRGATGLMSGAGNPGASVNLVRKRASSKEFTGTASLAAGNWADHRGALDLSIPLSKDGRVRARVAAMAEERDSHLERYHTRNRALLATVEADLTPSTTVWAGWEHQAKRPTGVTWGGLPMVYKDGTPTHWARSFSIGADWTYWNTTSDTVYAGLEHRLDNGWAIKANASRLESDYESKLFYLLSQPEQNTGTGLNPFPNYSRQSFAQNSANLQATGPFSLLGREHEAVLGLTASQSNYRYGNFAYTASPIGSIFDWDGSYPEPIWGNFQALGNDRTRQHALYGAVRLSLSDDLKFIIGGRQTRWESRSISTTRQHDVFTPYAGAIFNLDTTYAIYASYTDIFQPQNYQSASGAYLDPVIGKSYEAGIKAAYLDGRLNASFAVFRINQDNVAVLDDNALVSGTTNQAYRGEKGVRSKGFEAELSGELAKGWQLSAGFARTLAQDAEGARLQPQRPRNLAHMFTSYRLPGSWSQLTVGGGLQWRGDTYATTTTSTGVEARRGQGSVVLADLMLSYAFTPQLSGQLNVSNLFDKHYYDFAGSQIYYGAPRKAMLTLNYKF